MGTFVRRRRRLVAFALAAALLPVAAWHYGTLYRDATAARASLLSIEDDLALGFDPDALDALDTGAGAPVSLEDRLDHARSRIESARMHLRWDPLLQAARWLPVAGDQVIATDAFLKIASALVAVGDETVALAHTAIEARAEHEAEASGEPITATAFELLEAAGPTLMRVDALLDQAVARRLEVGDRALLGPLDAARTRLDEQLPEIVELVARASAAQAVLPELLGFEGERRYLLLSLNNAELMPGGGLVTAAGLLHVRDGDIIETSFRNTATWLPAYQQRGGEFIEAPAPLQRHLLKEYPWNLGVVNWDPDFTVWAHQALDFYERAWGPQEVDGIVAVDLDVLEDLLNLTGAQTVEAPGFGSVRLTSENAVMELERVTRAPEDTWRRSKAVVGTLQQALLREVLALPASQWTDLAEVVQRLGDERHMQVLLLNPDAQALVTDLGWDGRILEPSGDYLHFNEASVNSTKLNAVFVPDAAYDIEVTALGTARHDLRVQYENTVREWARGRDPELVEHLMFGGQYGGYLRAFVPTDATRFLATLDSAPVAIEDEGATAHQRWFGVYVPVPADATREVGLSWSVPAATDDPDTYQLTMQKQPGTDGMCIDLNIHREGVPAALDITGGVLDADGRVCLTSDVTVRADFR